MSKHELGATSTNTIPLEAEWIRVDAAVRFSSLSRSLLYENFDTSGGPIKTAVIRKRNALRGVRLVNLESLRDFILSHASSPAQEAPPAENAEEFSQ